MNFEGAKPISIPRYGSSCEWDDEVNLPLGLARISRNQRYTAQSTATRWGHSTQLKFGLNNSLTGGGLLRYLAAQPGTLNLQAVETILLFAYGFVDGNIYSCPPFLQANKLTLTDAAFFLNTGFTAFTGLNPTFRQAFNQMFVALADLLLPSQPPLVYNSSDGILYPASDLPFGAPWNPNTYYRVGQVVSPSQFQTFGQTDGQGAWVEIQTGYLYQCVTAGTSGNAASQPTWPPSFDGTVTDNTVHWKECTPIYISGLPDAAAPITPTSAPDGGSPIIDGATVYLAATLLNTVGEGINDLVNVQGTLDPKKVLTWKNTTGGPVDLTVVMPAIQSYLQTSGSLGATYGATHLNLYAFIDPTSTADPSSIIDPSFYALVNGAPVLPGASVTLAGYPTGAELSAVSTAATTATIGNVDTGVRYLVTFFQTQTTYQTGFSNSAAQSLNVTQSGWPIQCLRLPIGPYNCQARVVGASVAGASAAGPFTYISQADVESPGFNQANVAITSTLVEDNTSTTALFNFTDTYLPGATDVTNYFDKIQLPPVVDIYFAKSIQRVVYTGAVGYQSGHLFSDIQDPETVRIPGGNFQVSENDGDRTVCYREIRGIGYSFKENSGFVVEQNGGDPSTWTPKQVWGGNGPVGPAAIDVAGQDDSEFAMWVHRSGVYLFTGNAPTLISREQQDTWETIDWDLGHLIKLRIDHVRRLVHILVPLKQPPPSPPTAASYLLSNSNFGALRSVDSSGIISTAAYTSADPLWTDNSGFEDVYGLVSAPDGSVYCADFDASVVWKIAPDGVTVTRVAGTGVSGYSGDGGSALAAKLWQPAGLCLDAAGNLYISDVGPNSITNPQVVRVVNTGASPITVFGQTVAAGNIQTIAGGATGGFSGDTGPAASALLSAPYAVQIDTAGNLWICDQENNRIRTVDSSGIINTIIGNGTQGFAGDGGAYTSGSVEVGQPTDIKFDSRGVLYITDGFINERIRAANTSGGSLDVNGVTIAAGNIDTIAGNGSVGFAGDGGPALSAEFRSPWQTTPDGNGGLYICDSGSVGGFNPSNFRVRLVTADGTISTVAGVGGNPPNGLNTGDGGPATAAGLGYVTGLVILSPASSGSPGPVTPINARLVMNYYFGTGDPVVFVQRRGILVPNVEGRKWSQDDLSFNDAVYIPQKSKNAVQLAGVNVENQMVFFAADGSIKNMVDGQYYDEDYNNAQVGYFSNWIGVLGESPSMSFDKLVGARMWCTGDGLCNVTAYDDQDTAFVLTTALSPYLLTAGRRTRASIPMSVQGVKSMRWAVGMDNGGVAGAWWEVFKSDLMVIPTWPGQPG